MATSVSASEAELLVNVFGETAFRQLTNSQIHALTALLKSCPKALVQRVSGVKKEQYEENFRQYGINTGRGSIVQYRNLLSAASTLLPVYDMSKAESTQLLTALCRSPNSRLVSVPLFLALTMAWKNGINNSWGTLTENSSGKGGNVATPTKSGQALASEYAPSPPGSPDGAQQAESIVKSKEERHKDLFNALTMEIPEYMYIFDLIRERLSLELTRIDTVSKTIPLDDFVHMLRRSRTVIDENKLRLFMDAIRRCSVGSVGVSVPSCGDTYDILDRAGRINASNLLGFCSLCEQGIIFQLPGYAANKAQIMQTRISSHLLRAVKKVWPATQKALARQYQPTVSMEGFGDALRSAGVGLSTDDKIRIWRAVCDGTSCSPNDVTIAKLNLFLQNVVEVESDPNAFILTSLINRGDTGHAVRKSIPGAKTVFMNDLDLKWHEAIPDKTRQYVGDQEVKSKAHFGHEARVGGKNALPWEEQFAETGHADSAALHKNDVEGQHMHHYKEGEVDVALPWMDHFSSEGTVSTNLHRRIVNRVNSLSPKNFKELVSALKLHSHAQQLNIDRKEHAGRPLSRKDQVDFNNVRGDEHVSRITLRQSLGEAGVHVGPTDSAELFTAIAGFSTGNQTRLNHGDSIDHPVTMNNVFLWMASVQNCGNDGKEVLKKYSDLIGDHYIPAPTPTAGKTSGGAGGEYSTIPLHGGDKEQYGTSLAVGSSTYEGDPGNEHMGIEEGVLRDPHEGRHYHGVQGPENESTQDVHDHAKKHYGDREALNERESDSTRPYLLDNHPIKRHSDHNYDESQAEYDVVPSNHKHHFKENFGETKPSASEVDRPQQRHSEQQLRETLSSSTEIDRAQARHSVHNNAESTYHGNDRAEHHHYRERDVAPPAIPNAPVRPSNAYGEDLGPEQGAYEPGPVTHDSIFGFGDPAKDSGAKDYTSGRRRAHTPVDRDIFNDMHDERESKWEARPLPAWRIAAADRARGGDSASRIFGQAADDVPTPPVAPRTSLGTSMLAAKNAQGTLAGAGGVPIGTEDVLAIMQTKRANLALVFRRLAAQSDHQGGVVQLKDFCRALPDLVGGAVGAYLTTQPEVCWQVACDITSRPHTLDPHGTNNPVHYNDVVKFLDRMQKDAETGLNGPQLMRSLKDKCYRSRDLQGDKMRMLSLTPQLRQRLKQRYISNRMRSRSASGIAGVHDFVNAHDLMDLFATIDLHLSTSEARYICDQTAQAEHQGMLEPSTRLSAAVQFISNNALA